MKSWKIDPSVDTPCFIPKGMKSWTKKSEMVSIFKENFESNWSQEVLYLLKPDFDILVGLESAR